MLWCSLFWINFCYISQDDSRFVLLICYFFQRFILQSLSLLLKKCYIVKATRVDWSSWPNSYIPRLSFRSKLELLLRLFYLFRIQFRWLNSIHYTNSLFFAFYQQFPAASSRLKENASKTLAWDPSASLCLCQVIKSFNFTVFLVRICFLISEKSISFFVSKKYQSVLIVT